MALLIYIDGVDRAHKVRLVGQSGTGEGFHTSAAAMSGVVEVGLIEVEDEDGSLEIPGWAGFHIDETTASPERIATGFIGNVDQTAGPFRVGPGRVHRCDTVDLNWNLTRIALEPPVVCKRPAETDLQRLAWLMGVLEAQGLVYTGVLTDLYNNPVQLGESDFTDMFAIDVLTDMCPVAGKTAYVTWDYLEDRPQLFYDLTTTTIYDSTAAISDGEGDSDGVTVFAPRVDPVLHRVIEDAYSDVWLRYQNGMMHLHDAAFETDHARRDLVLSTSRIGSRATALAYAQKALAAHNHVTDSIDCEVEVEAAQVNDILEGHRLYYKSTHFTGFTSYAYTRVERRTVRQVDDQARRFILGLQLSERVLSALPGGPPPSDFPHPPPGPPTLVQTWTDLVNMSGQITLPQAPSQGNLLVYYNSKRTGTPTAPVSGPSWTDHPHGTIGPGSDGARMMYRTVQTGETATIYVEGGSAGGLATVWELADTELTPDASSFADTDTGTQPAAVTAGTLSPTAGRQMVLLEGKTVHCSDWGGNGDTTLTPDGVWTLDGEHTVLRPSDTVQPFTATDQHPIHSASHQIVSSSSGTYGTSQTINGAANNFGGWGGLALAFAGSGADNTPPTPGQEEPWTVVEMTTVGGVSTGVTAFPYADRALKVKVDGVLISPASYVETIPECGDFALTWEIDPDETVTVSYQGR